MTAPSARAIFKIKRRLKKRRYLKRKRYPAHVPLLTLPSPPNPVPPRHTKQVLIKQKKRLQDWHRKLQFMIQWMQIRSQDLVSQGQFAIKVGIEPGIQAYQESVSNLVQKHEHILNQEIEPLLEKKAQALDPLFALYSGQLTEKDAENPLLKANFHWPTLFSVRNQWDTYLAPLDTPGATHIPMDYIVPPLYPKARGWKQFLHK